MDAGGLTLGIDIGGTSIKGVLLERGHEKWRGRSEAYARPGADELRHAIVKLVAATGLRGSIGAVARLGLCAPGLRDERGVVTKAVNLPGLVGVSPGALVTGAARELAGAKVVESTDSHAAAVDYWRTHPAPGRLLALSMGTGIGACVLDGEGAWPRALVVTGRGPGQIGQMDVGEGPRAEQPIGPDGGRGTFEAYWGLPALRAKFGNDSVALQAGLESGLDPLSPPLSVLVRAIRVMHAVYLPRRVVLLGGVGIRLRPVAGAVRAAVSDGLTTLAYPQWTLECGVDEFHAARGAAALAVEDRAAG